MDAVQLLVSLLNLKFICSKSGRSCHAGSTRRCASSGWLQPIPLLICSQACIQMQVHLHLQVQMRHLHLHLHLNAPMWAHLHLHLHLNRRHLHLHLHLIQMHLIGFKCHSNANQMRLECNIINYLHKIDAIHRN